MKQSRFRYLGLLDLLLVGCFAAVFGVEALVASPVLLMSFAGICAILAGTVSALSLGPLTVSWRHLVGLSYATFALAVPAIYLPMIVAGTASPRELLAFAVATLGALPLAFYGVDVARGGRHFSVTPDVDRAPGK